MKTRGSFNVYSYTFNLASEKVVRDSEIKTKGTTHSRSTQIVAYPRDVVGVGRSQMY